MHIYNDYSFRILYGSSFYHLYKNNFLCVQQRNHAKSTVKTSFIYDNNSMRYNTLMFMKFWSFSVQKTNIILLVPENSENL